MIEPLLLAAALNAAAPPPAAVKVERPRPAAVEVLRPARPTAAQRVVPGLV